MEDQEIIYKAVQFRNCGYDNWAGDIEMAVMRDCGECADRVKRLHKAVMEIPLPTFTRKQLGIMFNDMTILGFEIRGDRSVVITQLGGREIRGTLIEEQSEGLR